jgi:hypothetical protein
MATLGLRLVAARTPADVVEPAPTRFTAVAKEAWASVPEAVRADVLRMEKELMAGLGYRASRAGANYLIEDGSDHRGWFFGFAANRAAVALQSAP